MSNWRDTSLGLLPSDWDTNPLGNLLYIKGRIGWKGLKKSEYLEEGYAIINGEQIIDGKVDWPNVGRIPKDRYDESPEIMLKEGDILMTKDGTIGKLAYIDKLPEPATVASGVFVIREESQLLYQKYLYYFFRSHYFEHLIKSRTEGSVIPHLYQRDFTEMEIPLPERNEQIRIAQILSILDKKIDNLKRQNETLVNIAQTLFKSWFIDFKFHNAEGKPYKSSGGKMIDSFLGLIPKDWKVGKLGDEFNILMGQSPTGDSFNEKGVGTVFYQGRTDFGFRFPKIRLYTTEPKRMAEIADVLVSVRAPVGDINVAFENCCIGRGLAAIKSKFKSYCLYKIMSLKPQFKVFETEGTVFGSLNKDNFNNLEITIPDKKTTEVFNKIANPMDLKFFNNEKQIRKLADIKERLLPKLISGQVRIKE